MATQAVIESVESLVAGVVAGNRRGVARCLRRVDDDPELGRAVALGLRGHLNGAQVIGITGNPGAGKSTVVDGLIALCRAKGQRVAVLAVDPSSPFSGGAILGDRIRMSRHATDDGVFIRSLATRGALGGLSRATFDSVRVLDAAGFDVVLVETVGVGQDEVDIARLAHTTVVVMVPGLGDDVQAIKAGLLEIADIFLINKSDREGAADLERSLRQMLALAPPISDWEVPIVRAVALRAEGLDELLGTIESHAQYLASPEGQARMRVRSLEVFDRLLDAALVDRGRRALSARLEQAQRDVARDGTDPYQAVVQLLSH